MGLFAGTLKVYGITVRACVFKEILKRIRCSNYQPVMIFFFIFINLILVITRFILAKNYFKPYTEFCLRHSKTNVKNLSLCLTQINLPQYIEYYSIKPKKCKSIILFYIKVLCVLESFSIFLFSKKRWLKLWSLSSVIGELYDAQLVKSLFYKKSYFNMNRYVLFWKN